MRHISMTPFGRQPVTAGLLATQALAEAPAPASAPDKWAVLRDTTTARRRLDLSDRDLAVLAALLTFHPAPRLADDAALIVFPSNRKLSERAHGMPESTLRRHLAALVRAGLILRRDSPNGKRYARRDLDGGLDRAFGFDLRPLLIRAGELARMAREVQTEILHLRRLREIAVIRLRDCEKMLLWRLEQGETSEGALTVMADLRRRLRRKSDAEAMQQLIDEATALLHQLTPKTKKMSGDDSENERHIHNSNTDESESEAAPKGQQAASGGDQPIPLSLVLKAAPDICDYSPERIRDWRDFVNVAHFVRPMLGIGSDLWHRSCEVMGPENAAMTLACILQRAVEIQKPGGYLRRLCDKAASTGFSPAPMIMALLRAENSRAA